MLAGHRGLFSRWLAFFVLLLGIWSSGVWFGVVSRVMFSGLFLLGLCHGLCHSVSLVFLCDLVVL